MVRIPSEYQEVEYLESTGTQYIDTGIYPQLNDAVEITFYSDVVGDHLRPFGAYVPGVAIDGYQGLRIWTAPNLSKQVDNTIYGKINNIKCLSDGTWILNDEVVLTDYPIKTNDRIAITIFKARYINGSLYGDADMKLYGFTYKRNGASIQNLIPCYRKSDNEPGMYDTVSKTFFTNAGTGTFLIGNDVNYSNTNLLEVRRRILLNTPHIESMSGNPAIFTTDMAANLKECKIRFSPVQAGEGTPSPENVRPISGWDGVSVTIPKGKNYIPSDDPENPMANYVGYQASVIYDAEENAFLSTGAGVSYPAHYLKNGRSSRLFVAPTDMVVTFSISYKNVGTSYGLRFFIKGSRVIDIHGGADSTWHRFTYTRTMAKGDTISLIIYSNIYWRDIQVELGTEATSYEPYVEPQTIDIPFPQTIYGGYVDLIKGEIVEEWKMVNIEDLNWNNTTHDNIFISANLSDGIIHQPLSINEGVSEIYKNDQTITKTAANQRADMSIFGLRIDTNYMIKDSTVNTVSDLVEKISGSKFAYLLATPNVYSLTPQIIKALKGLNNLYSDANGNIEIKFWSHEQYQTLSGEYETTNDNYLLTTNDGYVIDF